MSHHGAEPSRELLCLIEVQYRAHPMLFGLCRRCQLPDWDPGHTDAHKRHRRVGHGDTTTLHHHRANKNVVIRGRSHANTLPTRLGPGPKAGRKRS